MYVSLILVFMCIAHTGECKRILRFDTQVHMYVCMYVYVCVCVCV